MTNILFVILMLVQLLPDKVSGETHTAYLIGFAIVLEVLALAASILSKNENGLNHYFYESRDL